MSELSVVWARAFQLVKCTSETPAATAPSTSMASTAFARAALRLPCLAVSLLLGAESTAGRNGAGTNMTGATCTSSGCAFARRPGHPQEWSLRRRAASNGVRQARGCQAAETRDRKCAFEQVGVAPPKRAVPPRKVLPPGGAECAVGRGHERAIVHVLVPAFTVPSLRVQPCREDGKRAAGEPIVRPQQTSRRPGSTHPAR